MKANRKKLRYSAVDVADRLEQAAATLKKLPAVRVAGYRGCWPQVIHNPNEAFGWEPVRHVRSMPTNQQIDEMDETLGWLNWLDTPYEVKLVWGRATGIKWKILTYKFGFSRSKLTDDWKIAIIKITILANMDRPSDSYGCKKVLTASTQNSGVQNGRF